MSKLYPGRFSAVVSAETPDPFVLFLIGMRFNKLRAIHKWLPVFMAMPKMTNALNADPSHGYLHGYTTLSGRQIIAVQYWRSFDDLERFARNPSETHLGAWQAYNKAIGAGGSVGIFHETYVIEPTAFENVYANMPRIGLGAVANDHPDLFAHIPAKGRYASARKRIEGDPVREKELA